MKRMTLCVLAVVSLSTPLSAQTASDLFQRAVMAERTTGQLDSAIALYQRVVLAAGTDRALAARALLAMGRAYESLGRTEARGAYERVLRDYGEQRILVAQARARIAALNPSERPSSGPSSGAIVRRVAPDTELFNFAAVSPNGRYVAHQRGTTGDLAVFDMSLRTIRLLTANEREGPRDFAQNFAFSPNGLDIAYTWYRRGSRSLIELRVIALRGGNSRRVVLRDAGWLELCEWMPDGKNVLAVVQRDSTDPGALALIDIERGAVRRLRDFAFSAGLGASASPDGKWIAFAVPANDERGANPSIHIMAADGSRERTLVDHATVNWRPLWTPDGRGIVFLSDRAGSVGLWYLELVDGEPRTEPVFLLSTARGERLLGFARDGRLFYNPWRGSEFRIADLDRRTSELLGEPRLATNRFVGSNFSAELSPDGRFLTYVSARGPGARIAPGTQILVVADLTNGSQREFLPRLSDIRQPHWSPDARSIVIPGEGLDGRRGFFRLNVKTGALDTLTTAPEIQYIWSELSADGRSMFYPRAGAVPMSQSIWRYDFGDSTHHLVHASDSLEAITSFLVPTRDGQWLGFRARYRSPSGLLAVRSMTLALTTGEVRTLETGYQLLTALPGGYFLVGASVPAPNSGTELWRLPAAGGAPSKLSFVLRGSRNTPRVAADGSRIVFTIGSDEPNSGGIWTIENFLPAPRPATQR